MKELRQIARKVEKAHQPFEGYLIDLRIALQPYCDFDIFVTVFPDDGICVMRENGGSDVPIGMSLKQVIDAIKKDHRLTDQNWRPSY